MGENILFLQIYGGGGISGGTEVYLKNLLKELRKKRKKTELFVATLNKKGSIFSPFATVRDSFFSRFLESWSITTLIYRFSLLGFISYLWGIFWLYTLSSDIIPKNRIRTIYSNGGMLTAIVAYFLFKKYHIPYILHFHGLFNFMDLISGNKPSFQSFLFKGIVRNTLTNASQIVANSKEVTDDINTVKGLKQKAEIVHCFVDTQLFYPQNQSLCRKRLHIAPNVFVFLCPNRLDSDKGIDFLLESIPLIKRREIVFIFIGEGNLKPQLTRLAKRDKRIVVISQIKNELLPEYLNSSDIVWGPASVYYLGLSLIEALACGKPIMALNTPLPADNEYGRMVDPKTLPGTVGYLIEKDVNGFTHLIEKLHKNKSLLENKKKDCINFYNREYGEQNSKKVLKIIYNVMRQ